MIGFRAGVTCLCFVRLIDIRSSGLKGEGIGALLLLHPYMPTFISAPLFVHLLL